MENNPRMPTDTPLLRVLADLEREGFEHQFVPRQDGMILCGFGAHSFEAEEAQIHSERRLEGVSDPADMMIVYAVRCPVCGADGTLVLHYGPDAGVEEADVLLALPAP